MKEYSTFIFNDEIKNLQHKEIKLHNYIFDGEINENKVYKIKQSNDVVKVISTKEDYQSEMAIHQYLSKCKYILPVTAVNEYKDEILMKMPLGISLHNLFKNKHFNNFSEPIKKLRFLWANQIALGLLNVHENGIIHLDLKPNNVILTLDEFGILKANLSDFGLSQFIDGGNFGRNGNEVVTINYRDINISCGENYKTYKTDVWSFGFLLMKLFFDFSLENVEVNEERFNAQLIKLLKYDDNKESKKTLSEDNIWIAQRLFKNIKVPTFFKYKMLSKYKPLFYLLQDEDIKNVDYSNLISSKIFKNNYYNDEEWKQIWEVINSCLDLNIETRPSMYELVNKYDLFKEKHPINKTYLGIRDISMLEFDNLYGNTINEERLTKIWLKELKDLYPSLKQNKDIIDLLRYRASDILGRPTRREYVLSILKRIDINLTEFFEKNILKDCFIE